MPVLRARTSLRRAALILTAALAWASPAAADQPIGGACTTGTADGVQSVDGNNVVCLSSVWQYPAYQFGNSTATCNSTNAGITRYTGGNLQYCNSSAWTTLSTGGGALSSLTAATTTNSIDSSNWAQTWKWGTLSTQTALTLTSSSETSGTILNVSSSNPAATGYAGYFSQSGTGASYGIKSTNASTGTGYGIYASITGQSNSGFGGYFSNTDTSSTNANFGVYGITTGTNGSGSVDGFNVGSAGVAGECDGANCQGVLGVSSNGVGVAAIINNAHAALYASNGGTGNGNGVEAHVGAGTGNAVVGNADGNVTGEAGVVGKGNGASAATLAVQGVNVSTGAAYAVKGDMTGNSNTGYAGYFDNTPGTNAGVNYGVYATNNTTAAGYGVYGSITGASNTGAAIQAVNNSANGWGVYSSGTSPNYFAGNVGIGNTGPGALLDVGLAGTTTGTLRLEGKTSGYVQVLPLAAAGSWTMTLPNSGGTSGYVLSTDGTGITSWISNAGTASTALSSITAASGTHTIDSTNKAQTWEWGTLSTQTAMTLTTSSMTTGTLLSLQNTAVAATSTGKVLSISDTTTGAGYGVYSSMTGAANTGYAGYFTNTATIGANYALYALNNSTSGWSVYADGTSPSYFNNNVEIGGNVSPLGLLTVRSGNIWLNVTGSTNPQGYVLTGNNISGNQFGYFFGLDGTVCDHGMIYDRDSGRISIANDPGCGTLTEALTVTTTGSVGIGTTAPAYLLDVRDGSSDAQFHISGGNADGGGYFQNAFGSASNFWMSGGVAYVGGNWIAKDTGAWIMGGSGASMEFYTASGNTVGSGASLQDRLHIDGGTGDVTVDPSGANTGTLADLLQFGSSSGGEGIGSKRNAGGNLNGLDFWTNSAIEMSITNGGYVGIGTTGPSYPLHVLNTGAGDGSTFGTVFFGQNNTGYQNALNVRAKDDITDLAADYIGSANATNLTFSTRPSGSALAEAMRITSAGQVGIGTTSPTAPLDVAGAIRAEADSYVSTDFPKTSSTALAAITGLTSGTLAAGKAYAFDIWLYTTSNASGGIKVDLNGGSATATTLIGDSQEWDGTAIGVRAAFTTLSTGLCGITAVTTATCHITGTIIVNAGGTFIPRFAQNASNGTASKVKVGSAMTIRQLN